MSVFVYTKLCAQLSQFFITSSSLFRWLSLLQFFVSIYSSQSHGPHCQLTSEYGLQNSCHLVTTVAN